MEKKRHSKRGRSWVSVRVWAGILIIALFGAFSMQYLVKVVFFTFNPKTVGKDEVTLYEQRFEGLKQVLPSRGVWGYLTEQMPAKERLRTYYGTLYSLSPRVILDTHDCALIIGNFHGEGITSESFSNANMEVLAKFGSIYLLRNNRYIW